RTVVVGVERHERYLAAELGERPGPKVLKQPESRGTAAAVLLAAEWIAARDPHATVAFFPSDHFIREEAVFVEHVADVARFIRRQPGWLVLLGVPPSEPEPEYGWIEPGERFPGPVGRRSTGSGDSWRSRRRSWRKPCSARGASGTRSSSCRRSARCWRPDGRACRASPADSAGSRRSGTAPAKPGRFVEHTRSRPP